MKLVCFDKLTSRIGIATFSDDLQLFKLTAIKIAGTQNWDLYDKDSPILTEISWIHDVSVSDICQECKSLLVKPNVTLAWGLSFYINTDVIPSHVDSYIIETVSLNPNDEERKPLYADIPRNVLAASCIWNVIEKKFGAKMAAQVAFSRCNAATLYRVLKFNIEDAGTSIKRYLEQQCITEQNISDRCLRKHNFYGCAIRIFRGRMRRCAHCGRWCERIYCSRRCFGATLKLKH